MKPSPAEITMWHFTKVVEDRHFNPLREWLDALPEWDGVVRLENLYID